MRGLFLFFVATLFSVVEFISMHIFEDKSGGGYRALLKVGRNVTRL